MVLVALLAYGSGHHQRRHAQKGSSADFQSIAFERTILMHHRDKTQSAWAPLLKLGFLPRAMTIFGFRHTVLGTLCREIFSNLYCHRQHRIMATDSP
jgi:hypothetical protein